MKTQTLDLETLNAGSAEWIAAVGGYFRNFAVIELLSVEFVLRMADPFKYKSMKKKFLAQRLTWIMENIHERCASGEEQAQELIEVLESIREESYFRNVLAHGSAGLAFPEGEGTGAPALTGVLNFKPDDDSRDAEVISQEEILGRRDEAGALAGKLLACLNRMEFLPVG